MYLKKISSSGAMSFWLRSFCTCTESTLFLSVVTDETIQLDGLYILIRKDHNAALLTNTITR